MKSLLRSPLIILLGLLLVALIGGVKHFHLTPTLLQVGTMGTPDLHCPACQVAPLTLPINVDVVVCSNWNGVGDPKAPSALIEWVNHNRGLLVVGEGCPSLEPIRAIRANRDFVGKDESFILRTLSSKRHLHPDWGVLEFAQAFRFVIHNGVWDTPLWSDFHPTPIRVNRTEDAIHLNAMNSIREMRFVCLTDPEKNENLGSLGATRQYRATVKRRDCKEGGLEVQLEGKPRPIQIPMKGIGL